MIQSVWQHFLAQQSARAQNQAARDSTILAALTHLGVIRFSGADAAAYLHNLLTSDVKSLQASAFQPTAWCSPKGRVLANVILCRNGDDYLALLPTDLLNPTQTRLQHYVLRSKVVLSDESEQCFPIGIAGREAVSALQAAKLPIPETGLSACGEDMAVLHIEPSRYIVVAASFGAASDFWTKAAEHVHPVDRTAWQWLDIRAGAALVNAATTEKFTPQMLGLDKIGAVSFTKGCYPGQEVVARAQYLGQVKRHLYRVHVDAPSDTPPQAGDAIFNTATPETSCGTILQASPSPENGYDALAVVLDEAVTLGNLGLVGGRKIEDIEAV